jgi:hypothetical protein
LGCAGKMTVGKKNFELIKLYEEPDLDKDDNE